MTSPARGGPDIAGTREALAAVTLAHRRRDSAAGAIQCACGWTGPFLSQHQADALLPVVQRLAVEKAAEELRAAADEPPALFGDDDADDYVKDHIRDWLRARALALAAAAQPTDGRTGE